jgi:cytochrome c biogenesis protein CcdA
MLALIALALSIGIVDSINPSTVAPALYLATGKSAVRSVALFTAGAFSVYAVGGIAIALGPGQALLALLPRPGHHILHLLELVIGVGALVLAAVLWGARGRIRASLARRKASSGGHGPLLLGAGIMVVELPTAFPYFAVIAAVVGSGRNVIDQLIALLVFNLAFIAPLLGILALCAFSRSERTLEALRVRVDRLGPILIPALVLVVGIVLIVLGLT